MGNKLGYSDARNGQEKKGQKKKSFGGVHSVCPSYFSLLPQPFFLLFTRKIKGGNSNTPDYFMLGNSI